MSGSATTKWVYTVIKSFTANGSRECSQSYRSIAKRAGVDDKTVKRCIEELIKENWLERIGEGTQLGGSIPILKVRSDTAVKFGVTPQLKAESAESSPESAESLGTKRIQLNKLNNKTKLFSLEENKKQRSDGAGLPADVRRELLETYKGRRPYGK